MASRSFEPECVNMDVNNPTPNNNKNMEQGNHIRGLKPVLTHTIGLIASSQDKEIISSTTEDCKELSNVLDKHFNNLEEAIEEITKGWDDPKNLYTSLTNTKLNILL